jgi:hypothetical protein
MPDSKALIWDAAGERYYRTGIDKVALYVAKTDGTGYEYGVAWNGVSSIEEAPSGAEPTAIYADNIKYLNLISKEDFALNMTAYQAPDEFGVCDGTAQPTGLPGVKVVQQKRQSFGLVFRTNLGNDIEGNDYGYEYHLCYNLRAGVSTKQHQTINDSPAAEELSWSISSTEVDIPNMKPAAEIIIDTKKITAAQLTALEARLFGTENTYPELPLPADLFKLLNDASNP